MKRLVLTLAILCALLGGCGGITKNLVLMPVPPVEVETLGEESNGYWTLDLDGTRFRIAPVILSSKSTWVFGPLIAFPVPGEDYVPAQGQLRIGVNMTAKRKSDTSLGFDPNEFRVELEDGRMLSPMVAAEPVTFSSEQRPRWKWVWLEYEVVIAELTPFTLHLGTLTVNGEPVSIPPISFVHGESTISS